MFSDSTEESIKDFDKKDLDVIGQLHSGERCIKLFGKMESGQITKMLAFNTGNYFHTSSAKHEVSEDLWF